MMVIMMVVMMVIMMVVIMLIIMVVMAATVMTVHQYNNDRRCATEIYPGVREVENEVDESRRMIDSRIGALHSEVTFTW